MFKDRILNNFRCLSFSLDMRMRKIYKYNILRIYLYIFMYVRIG
nr:MAG TPA: hypothetical protein [Caudoviricetes sp.]